jgi:molybdopterin-guanine dinucleotide biosynthesis protein MobB
MTSSGKKKHHGERKFTYHPFEIALCGYSGSGKTTLACKLLQRWSPRYKVGFVKHDAHKFEMDKPGKDTYEASQAGAAVVMINDPRHFARINSLPYSRLERGSAFIDADFVLAEGFKHSDLPKLLLLDGEGRAWTEFLAGTLPNVLAVIGPGAAPEGLGELPFFQRDDVEGIAAFVENRFQKLATAPLYGLVLVGGESRRMGRPKWAIEYTGKSQAERTAELLAGVCEKVFLSVRAGQEAERLPDVPRVIDRFPAWGPLTGILSAMHEHPEAAWLVAACDLPFLDAATLAELIVKRRPMGVATAYRSSTDGLPEPLCAIWEPRAMQRIMQGIGMGLQCPRKILIESNLPLLDLSTPRALDNANTPEEYESARVQLRGA